MRPIKSKRSWMRAAALWTCVMVVPAAIGTAMAVGDTTTSSTPQVPTVDANAGQADAAWANAPYHAASDNDGRVAGYVKANPAEFDKNGSQPVYAHTDGSGGVVGYLTDFGYVDSTTYDAPNFDLNQARAAFRAKLEAEGRKEDPNFSLDQAQQQTVNNDFQSRGVTPPTTTQP